MDNKELFELVKIVKLGIERTGDYALSSKMKKEQEAMIYLQENYPDLYNSLLGNLAVCSSDGGSLNVKINKKGGIDLVFETRNNREETYYPNPEFEHEKIKHPEMGE